MSMHIEGPWLSTTGRRKGKIKYKSAEAKRQALELEREWAALKSRHASVAPKPVKSVAQAKVTVVPNRDDTRPQSLNSWVTGPVSSKPSQQYTGDNVKGIAVMHKSCLQPVFSQQEAIDSATMRR
jgi:Ser/Thr protein kinase RdoA (MazF antagonist)